uniref:Lipoprotein n=1 Tax=Conchiformibius kuhniae TaxID=211502 RepID=A0A8T9MWC1_9NEIS|nr:hypothetical protein LVJ77_04600 [Conchiformibius kuhniae]
MNKLSLTAAATLLALAACGGGQNEQDKQIQENNKKIELLKQEAEIKRLQNEVQNAGAQAASGAAQVYQLAASEVANTIPKEAQAAAKAGEVVQGKDGTSNTRLTPTPAVGCCMAHSVRRRAIWRYQRHE